MKAPTAGADAVALKSVSSSAPAPKVPVRISAQRLPRMVNGSVPTGRPFCLILSAALWMTAVSGSRVVLNERMLRYCLSSTSSPRRRVVAVLSIVPPVPLVSVDSRIQPSSIIIDFNVRVKTAWVGVGVTVGVDVLVAVAVEVGVEVRVGVNVEVRVAVAVCVMVTVAVGVAVLVLVAVAVEVDVLVTVGVAVIVSVGDSVSVTVDVTVGVWVLVAVNVSVTVGVAVCVVVSVAVAVTVAVSVLVSVGVIVEVNVPVAVTVGVCVRVVVGVGVLVVRIFKHQPPLIEPKSPVVSSMLYKLQTPLGFVPLKVASVVAADAPGAGE